MAEHDESYKLIFSHRQMVEELLEETVKDRWIREVDFSTLEAVKASFVSDDLREREDDVIWRVRCRDRWLYIYILLEFQSTVDPFMAIRIMVYVGLLYQDLIKQKQLTKSRRLPPVFPIVLYNGEDKWTAAKDVSELIEPMGEGLESFLPHLRYHLVAENEYHEEATAPLRSLVDALFRLENSESLNEIRAVLSEMVDHLQEPGQEGLARAIMVWLKRVLLPRHAPESVIPAKYNTHQTTSHSAVCHSGGRTPR